MERIVLADCPSEQVAALIEEHNKVVAIIQKFANVQHPQQMPRKIIAKIQ